MKIRLRLVLLAGLLLLLQRTLRSRSSMGKPRIIFSDIDGTLAHFEWQFADAAQVITSNSTQGVATLRYHDSGIERECFILPSRGAGNAYISKRTLELVAELRRQGTVFVLVTGARSSTFIKRRASLPAADFEVFESGGRMWQNGQPDDEWAALMQPYTGFDGEAAAHEEIAARPQQLWTEYRRMDAEGWHLDAHDYETEFRVIVETDASLQSAKSMADFDNEVRPRLATEGLACAANLGKIDIYPAVSGKANAARFILQRLGMDAADAVVLFDDDNDLELADMCGRGYLPSITHESVLQMLQSRPSWMVMKDRGPLGAEQALEEVLKLVSPDSGLTQRDGGGIPSTSWT